MNEKASRGLQASVNGFAHEHIAVGILMKRYKNVSLVDLPLSPYDIVIVLKDDKGDENIIRAQVRTAKISLSFVGGVRGGVDRIYRSDVKKYTQSPSTSDVVIGICPTAGGENKFDLYFFPTLLIEELGQNSISLKKISDFKNNYEILERCKDRDYVMEKAREFGIIR